MIYTKSLLHFNGVDGSTSFIDITSRIWTPAGNAQIDTAQSKFGGASGLFDGIGDYISTPDHDDFNFVGIDLTVDLWFRPASLPTLPSFAGLFGQEGATSYPSNFANTEGTNVRWVIRKASGGNGDIIDLTTSGVVLTINTWYHLAFVKYGNIYTIYIDGTARATITNATAVENIVTEFRVADRSSSSSGPFNGHIDEFRFSKGIARWIANFTPPTQPYGTGGGAGLFFL